MRLLEEHPVPDPEYTWATVFLFGSIAGDDALDQAMRIARLTPVAEPELRAALALADVEPHLQDADPEVVRAAAAICRTDSSRPQRGEVSHGRSTRDT